MISLRQTKVLAILEIKNIKGENPPKCFDFQGLLLETDIASPVGIF